MNHYQTLGVDKIASQDEIKRAYRMLAQKLHPDKPDGDIEQFQRVQKAYEVLSDPDRRDHYDRTGDENAPNYELIAYSRVAELFAMIIESDKKGNLIDIAAKRVQESISTIKLRITESESSIRKNEKKLNRISSKGENIFADVLTAKLDSLRQSIETLTEEIKINSMVLELIKNHTDDKPDDIEMQTMFNRNLMESALFRAMDRFNPDLT